MGLDSKKNKLNPAQTLLDVQIMWISGKLSTDQVIAEMLPIIMELDARVAKLEILIKKTNHA